MALRTHFTVKAPQTREGRLLKFVVDYRESVNGPVVGSQTFQCPVGATRADQERLMADAVRREVVTEDAAVTAVTLVPNGTTIAIAEAAPTQLATDIETFLNRYARRKQVMVAVNAGLVAANDVSVTSQLTQTQNAMAALSPRLTGAQILDLL